MLNTLDKWVLGDVCEAASYHTWDSQAAMHAEADAHARSPLESCHFAAFEARQRAVMLAQAFAIVVAAEMHFAVGVEPLCADVHEDRILREQW